MLPLSLRILCSFQAVVPQPIDPLVYLMPNACVCVCVCLIINHYALIFELFEQYERWEK
jgi:hypothetical protein